MRLAKALLRAAGMRWSAQQRARPLGPFHAQQRRCMAPAATAAQRAAAASHPVVYHPDFCINPVPVGHRFPMPKDQLLYQLLQERGLAGRTFIPEAPDEATLCLVHEPAYVRSFLDGSISREKMRAIGLEWSQQLVRRTLVGVGSAVLSARLALEFGVACMTNGGTHHAHSDRGSGWCIFNDQAVAARAAQRDAGVGNILFVDLDVHQGDGTASIFAADPTIFTFSMHCGDQGFPRVLQRSDLDIALPAATGDAEYMQVLRELLPPLLEREKPELVFYNAGTDVHQDDTLGQLALTNDGILARDRFVFQTCAQQRVPVAAAIGGGYEPNHHNLALRHLLLHQAASELLPELSYSGRLAAKAARVRA